MSPTNRNTLGLRANTRLAGYVALAGAALAAPAVADAAIIYSGPVVILIPVTTSGIYLNVVTNVSNISPGSAPGWDINPWESSTLGWFNPSAPAGGVYVTGLGSSTTLVDNLGLGALVSAASVFGSGVSETTGATAFNLNSDNNWVGFRFQNEAAGNAIQYGWVQIHLGASLTDPARAIIGYAYDNSGAGINTGAVPEPSTFALLGVMAAGALGVREWRKRKAA
jgi:hypothetical protein